MTRMQQNIIAGSVLFLSLLPGCERKASNEVPQAPAAPSKESASPHPAGTNATEMVRITGGRFIMGDKDEIDAPPHEVAVSSFLPCAVRTGAPTSL